MKRMMQMYFGIGVGNAILAPIGFIGPGPDWPGVFAGALSFGSFVVLGIISKVDDNARKEFIKTVSYFRRLTMNKADIQEKLDKIESDIMSREPLVHIAHDLGYLRGQLVEAGFIRAEANRKPEVDV